MTGPRCFSAPGVAIKSKIRVVMVMPHGLLSLASNFLADIARSGERWDRDGLLARRLQAWKRRHQRLATRTDVWISPILRTNDMRQFDPPSGRWHAPGKEAWRGGEEPRPTRRLPAPKEESGWTHAESRAGNG